MNFRSWLHVWFLCGSLYKYITLRFMEKKVKSHIFWINQVKCRGNSTWRNVKSEIYD